MRLKVKVREFMHGDGEQPVHSVWLKSNHKCIEGSAQSHFQPSIRLRPYNNSQRGSHYSLFLIEEDIGRIVKVKHDHRCRTSRDGMHYGWAINPSFTLDVEANRLFKAPPRRLKNWLRCIDRILSPDSVKGRWEGRLTVLCQTIGERSL